MSDLDAFRAMLQHADYAFEEWCHVADDGSESELATIQIDVQYDSLQLRFCFTDGTLENVAQDRDYREDEEEADYFRESGA